MQSQQSHNHFTANGNPFQHAHFHIHMPLFVNLVVVQPPQPQAQQPQPNAQQTPFTNQEQQQAFFNMFLPFLLAQGAAMQSSQQNQTFSSYQQMVNNIFQQSFMQQQQQQQGPPPTRPEYIAKLPVFKLSAKRAAKLQGSDNSTISCSVCQCECEHNEELIQLPCQHVYHKDCCMQWIEKHNTCPTCRFEMEVSDAKEETQRRKRMEQQYTAQGLKIMDIHMQVQNLYTQMENILLASGTNSPQEFKLKGIDNQLTILSMQLDSLGELNNKPKEQRKQVLKIIQAIQSEIDSIMVTLSQNADEMQL